MSHPIPPTTLVAIPPTPLSPSHLLPDVAEARWAFVRIEYFHHSTHYNSKVVVGLRDAIVSDLEVEEVQVLHAPAVRGLRIDHGKLKDTYPPPNECELRKLQEAIRHMHMHMRHELTLCMSMGTRMGMGKYTCMRMGMSSPCACHRPIAVQTILDAFGDVATDDDGKVNPSDVKAHLKDNIDEVLYKLIIPNKYAHHDELSKAAA